MTQLEKGSGSTPITVGSPPEIHALQEQLRVAFEDNPVGQILMDLSGEVPAVAQANRTLEAMLGYQPGELAGTDILRLVHPDDFEFERAVFERSLAGGGDEVAYRTRRRHRSGVWIPVYLAGRLVRDAASGAPRYALASVVDITAELLVEEEREAALALAERRAALARAVSDLAGLALAAGDTGPFLDSVARRVAEVLPVDFCWVARCEDNARLRLVAGAGWDEALLDSVGQPMGTDSQSAYTLEADGAVVVEDWHTERRFRRSPLLEAHAVRSGLSVAVRHGGHSYGVIGVQSRVRRRFDGDDAGFLEAVARLIGLAIARDVAATDLERSERTLQTLVDNAPAAIYMLDAEGRFTLVNRQFERMVGATRESVIGRTWDAVPDRSSGVAARHIAADGQVLAGAAAQSFQEEIPAAGEFRHYMSVDFPLPGAGRQLLGLAGISTDVTALKQAEHAVQEAWRQTLRRIANAVEYRDEETGAHIERMAALCGLIAGALDLDDGYRADLIAAATLHDAGKIAIPDRILLKPGRLTDEERRIMESHCDVGHRLLSGSGSPLLDLAASIAWTHHERYDGSGYPRRLVGPGIPLEGRIAAVADVFDAMTSDRVYRPGVPVEETVLMMRGQRGRHFDPEVLDAFLGRLDEAVAIRDSFATRHAEQLERTRAGLAEPDGKSPR